MEKETQKPFKILSILIKNGRKMKKRKKLIHVR